MIRFLILVKWKNYKDPRISLDDLIFKLSEYKFKMVQIYLKKRFGFSRILVSL